jgi:hypothetical protein
LLKYGGHHRYDRHDSFIVVHNNFVQASNGRRVTDSDVSSVTGIFQLCGFISGIEKLASRLTRVTIGTSSLSASQLYRSDIDCFFNDSSGRSNDARALKPAAGSNAVAMRAECNQHENG